MPKVRLLLMFLIVMVAGQACAQTYDENRWTTRKAREAVLQKYPELKDSQSDLSKMFARISAEHPDYAYLATGPLLVMRDMERELNRQYRMDMLFWFLRLGAGLLVLAVLLAGLMSLARKTGLNKVLWSWYRTTGFYQSLFNWYKNSGRHNPVLSWLYKHIGRNKTLLERYETTGRHRTLLAKTLIVDVGGESLKDAIMRASAPRDN